jgi:hypothetical protein
MIRQKTTLNNCEAPCKSCILEHENKNCRGCSECDAKVEHHNNTVNEIVKQVYPPIFTKAQLIDAKIIMNAQDLDYKIQKKDPKRSGVCCVPNCRVQRAIFKTELGIMCRRHLEAYKIRKKRDIETTLENITTPIYDLVKDQIRHCEAPGCCVSNARFKTSIGTLCKKHFDRYHVRKKRNLTLSLEALDRPLKERLVF